MKPSLPLALSFNGGYVDTAGFLALQGLFTAHVTGNFVTLGAALVLGTSGVVAKLLALPVFCLVVISTRYASYSLRRRGLPILRTMLALEAILLLLGAVFACFWGPFPNGDSWQALTTGLTLVAGMAIQNAAHRIHFSSAPPTTLMTGTTTQVMIDIADWLHGFDPDSADAIRTRLLKMSSSVFAFALGCGVAALAYAFLNVWCFVLPALMGLYALFLVPEEPRPTEAKDKLAA